jgi:hypothetical protein
MVGPKDDAGIIPRVCEELFARMEHDKDSSTHFRVRIVTSDTSYTNSYTNTGGNQYD